MSYLKLSATEAIEQNAGLVLPADPGPAARPFIVPQGPGFERATECLTAAIYYEARTESETGQRAVAQVVLNRVRHPAFPKTICGVVYQGSERTTGCQFTFTCDGSLARMPIAATWARARRIAVLALQGMVEPSVGVATHYHANYVVPYWASSLTPSATVGAHLFYRWAGYWGTPAAFHGRYAMSEPNQVNLRSLGVTVGTGEMPDSLKVAGTLAASSDDAVPAAASALRTLKADFEAGTLREELQVSRPLVADSSGAVALAADEGRTSLE
ncbi:cell wall hydrolase [Sphingomonas tagetis]|uniref:cell wall hydrolase n=1 Tax=Sphingomonas tagetis TaxID=2949092 RepID=UPI003F55F6A1